MIKYNKKLEDLNTEEYNKVLSDLDKNLNRILSLLPFKILPGTYLNLLTFKIENFGSGGWNKKDKFTYELIASLGKNGPFKDNIEEFQNYKDKDKLQKEFKDIINNLPNLDISFEMPAIYTIIETISTILHKYIRIFSLVGEDIELYMYIKE